MPKESVVLSGKTFSSKKSAEAFLREIKDRHRPGEFLSDDETAIVLAALRRHPACSEKIGLGVRRVGLYSNGGTRSGYGFGIEQIDGSIARFSYHECFAAQRRPHSDRVLEALRHAVRPYILRWRDATFEKHGGHMTCPVTGTPIQLGKCHVDHESPAFVELVSSFLINKRLEIDSVTITVTHDHQVEAILSDHDLKTCWIKFHNKNCKLRLVSIDGHRLQHGHIAFDALAVTNSRELSSA